MQRFKLYLKNGFVFEVYGYNMVDACLRAGGGVDLKTVIKYQENGGNVILFSK